MYYQHSITEIQSILKNAGFEKAKEDKRAAHTPKHVLWMCKQIEKFDERSITEATKAGRWIGWIFCAMEELKFLTNGQARKLAKVDKENKFDLPASYRHIL